MLKQKTTGILVAGKTSVRFRTGPIMRTSAELEIEIQLIWDELRRLGNAIDMSSLEDIDAFFSKGFNINEVEQNKTSE